jgi:hypothetical protein
MTRLGATLALLACAAVALAAPADRLAKKKHHRHGGKLAEVDSSPVPLPVPLDTRPLGLALVPHH